MTENRMKRKKDRNDLADLYDHLDVSDFFFFG